MTQHLLMCKLELTGLSEQFCAKARSMGFDTLKAVLDCPPGELLCREQFSYGWLGELINFLTEHASLHLLQSTPGSNHD